MKKLLFLLLFSAAFFANGQVSASTCPYLVSCNDTLAAGSTSDSVFAQINVPYTTATWSVKAGTPGSIAGNPNGLAALVTGLQTGKTTVVNFTWTGPTGTFTGTTTITVLPATVKMILKVVQVTTIFYSDGTSVQSTQTYQ